MDFKVGELYYVAWGLSSSNQDNRPNPKEIYGVGIFTHIQDARGEKSYNFEPCMTLGGAPAGHRYCIGEEINLDSNRNPVEPKYVNAFYNMYPDSKKKEPAIDLSNILKPTTSSIIEFIQNLEAENKKLKEENKKLVDLHNSTCELLDKLHELHDGFELHPK